MAAEEWRQCVDWLVRCEILPPDNRATQFNATVFDLAQTLRDGVLLCQLLMKLRRRAIEQDFAQRPQMSQFLCLKNIRIFLQTCKTEFKLEESDLFDPHDLFDLKDFGTVVSTLSKLSKSEKALECGIEGFPNGTCGPSQHHTHDDEIYKNLEELGSTEMPDEGIYGQVTGEDEEAEKVYEDLLSIRSRAAQSSVPSPAAAPPYRGSLTGPLDGRPPQKSKREYCIEEILGTEKNYVDALDMITKHFIQPLRTVIDDQHHDTIFNNIEKLLSTHRLMQTELNKAVQQCSGNLSAAGIVPKLAEVFVKYKSQLVVYGDYCAQLTKAQNLVDDLTNSNVLVRQKILEQQQIANKGKFKLRDLLAVPMQRVLKYQLLLRELMKHIDKVTAVEERACLEKALEAMLDLSLYVNEVKRDRESLEVLTEIQSSITDLKMPDNTELKDYGRLLKDGELRVKDHNNNKECRRYIFLFDKVMMMCKARGDSYSFKSALVLHQHRIDEGMAIAVASSVKGNPRGTEKWRHIFMLVECFNQSAYTFYAKSEDMKQKWIEAIKLALENYQPPGAKDNGHDFIMRSFPQPTQCDHCGKLLRGCFYQGYQCSITKRKAHKECIPNIVRDAALLMSRPLPNRKVRATHTYMGIPPTTDNKAVLRFNVGDIIDLTNDTDPNWWQGRLDMHTGYFPSSYVESYRAVDRRNRSQGSYEQTMIGSPNGRPPLLKGNSSRSSSLDSSAGALPSPRLAPTLAHTSSNVAEQSWFVGRMSRDQATQNLQNLDTGIYLVRESDNPSRRGEYALSLKYMGSVKHIKVNRNEIDGTYYLADCKFFRSLVELVEYYKLNSLELSFPEVRSTLVTAYKDAVAGGGERRMSPVQPRLLHTVSENDAANRYGTAPVRNTASISGSTRRSLPPVLGYAVASYDYASTEPSQISLRCNDRVAVVNKAGGDRGWWKGYVVDAQGNQFGRVGFFPLAYVEEDEGEVKQEA